MQHTIGDIRLFTVALLVIVLLLLFIVGLWLRARVKDASLHPSVALRVIETIAVVVGGGVGSVAVLLLLLILWPAAGNWVINQFLPDTIIWQTQLQQWITRNMDDPTTSSAIGLLIQRIQFGSAFLGFIAGWIAKWLVGTIMGRSYHTGITLSETAPVTPKR
jgi:hypothetical protein